MRRSSLLEEGRGAGVEHPRSDAADQPPAARSLRRIDPGVSVRHRQAPGGHADARSVQTRDGKPARHISEPGRKSEERDDVLGASMAAHDFFRGDAELTRNLLEIGAVIAGLDADSAGQRPISAARKIQPLHVEQVGIVEQEQGPRAGNGVEQPLGRIVRQRCSQVERLLVGQREQRRAVAELLQLRQRRPAPGRGSRGA